MNRIIVLALTFFVFSYTAFAHQPRFTNEGITAIDEAEVSKAFYTTVSDEKSDVYTIGSDVEFNLFVSLLIPDIPGVSAEGLTIAITKPDGKILFESAQEHKWTPLYEPFANDNYFEGPTFEQTVPAGVHTITVSGGEESSKYVLVTGKKELFPLKEIWNTIVLMPELKMEFFEKPFYMVYWNPVGGGVFLLLCLMLGIGALTRKIIGTIVKRA